MIFSRFSNYIVLKQIKKGLLSEDDQELYAYGYEVLLNQVANLLMAILIGAIFSAWIEIIIFMIIYLPIRSYCGGYHASTNARCILVSSLLLLLVCILSGAFREYHTVMLEFIGVLVAGAIIFVLAPVEDANKPLDEVEIHRYRWISRAIWAVQAVVWMIFSRINPDISFVIAISQVILSMMLFVGELKNTSG